MGIDDEGLRLLNYSSMSDLLNVCSDVADLFANEPGYIHNFKNFGWIDFLLHADSDASSAIVHANGRVFSCKLSVSSFYLSENPLQNGYSIDMSHIQTLSGEEIRPHTISPKIPQKEYIAPPIEQKIDTLSPLPDYTHITPTQLKEPTVLDIPNLEISAFDEIEEHPVDETHIIPQAQEEFVDDLENSPFKTYIESEIPEPPKAKKLPDKPMLGSARYNAQEKACLDRHTIDKNYKYDPQVAANELGLPVDLIEEFIGDFIQQSHDFKDALFESSAKNDFNNLHILSHKLKGVAANLRIEDAFETLSVINTSTDTMEIDANLKFYFDIIKKLSGESVEGESSEEEISDSTDTIPEAIEDIYSYGLKLHDDEPLIVQTKELESQETPEEPLSKKENFEKILLDLDDSFNDTKLNLPEESVELPLENEPLISLKDEESFNNNIEKLSTHDEPHEDILLKDDKPFLDQELALEKSRSENAITLDNDLDELTVSTGITPIHYDKLYMAQSLGIDPHFMDELLFDYKNDSRLISNQINDAIKAFDTVSWNTNAAKLKGISDNLRLTEISEELAILSKTHDAQEAKKASIRLNAYLDQL
jgi:hypothetical protein